MAPVRDQQRIDRTQVLLSALSCDVWYCPRAIPEIVHVAHALKSEYFQIFNELVVPLGAEELALSLSIRRKPTLSEIRTIHPIVCRRRNVVGARRCWMACNHMYFTWPFCGKIICNDLPLRK